MNSNSIETQQHGNTENSKIAGIYQRMLLGDKSALSNLQKVKVFMHHNPPQQPSQTTLPYIRQNFSLNNSQVQRKSKHQSPMIKNITYEKIKTINNEQRFEQAQVQQDQRQDEKQKQKLRSFIKKKVYELRTQKEILKHQQENQLNEIKKINQNIRLNTNSQSKSYDLVRKKQAFSTKSHQKNPTQKQHAKQRFQSLNVKKGLMKKVQSYDQYNAGKHLPPLREKRKIPTQNSDQKSEIDDSSLDSRKNVRTPINLARSTVDIQPGQLQIEQRKKSPQKTKQLQIKLLNPSQQQNQQKVERSRSIKISLPQMKKQRQQFALINQNQKNCQLEVLQFHQQTRKFIEEVRLKYNLNFRNEEIVSQAKNMLNTEPISNTVKINSKKQLEQQPHQSKKKPFQSYEDKVNEKSKDITLINEIINNKKEQRKKIEEKLAKNKLMQFWERHDFNSSDFFVEDEQEYPQQFSQKQESLGGSRMTEAYSTVMQNTRDKNWKSKIIKQYDTNRSFQQYSKSRRQAKQPSHKQNHQLNQIDENDEREDSSENKVTVNSRLKKLLLV